MRVFVVFDSTGEITALATQPEGAPPIGRNLGPGERAGYVDIPEVDEAADTATISEQLLEVQRRYRIESAPSEFELMPKTEPGTS